MSDLKAVRKHTASHDLFNRIHSIAADEAFVKHIAREVYNDRFEVVPNQRCGTWYCDPSSSSTAYAYFKSTDGHTNNWNFNLRRSNLPLASYAEARGGLIIVDSTRRGKRMPDALSKTIPIWCTVVNLAIQLRAEDEGIELEWDSGLYLPPNIVSPSEKSQILSLIPGWAAALETSTLPLPRLTKPLRPFFIHPATTSPPQIPTSPTFTPIICVSASKWAGGDDVPRATRIGSQTVGFEYVPGAGDDDELWARGLKPPLYHSKRTELLSADRDDLPELVDELVALGEVGLPVEPVSDALSLHQLSISDTPRRLVGVPGPTASLAVDIGPPSSPCPEWTATEHCSFYIVEVDRAIKDTPWIIPIHHDKIVAVPNPRTDSRSYGRLVKELIDAVKQVDDRNVVIRPARPADFFSARNGEKTTPAPMTGSDLVAARKLILPLVVALDCARHDGPVDKGVIADSLHRLVALWPDGNPPRAALKRVNEVLMSGGAGGG